MQNEWQEFLKLREKVAFKNLDAAAITLRIPKQLKKIILEDIRTLEDEDQKISFNEYILLQMMNHLSITQSPEGEFRRNKNLSLEKYVKDSGGELKKKRARKAPVSPQQKSEG